MYLTTAACSISNKSNAAGTSVAANGIGTHCIFWAIIQTFCALINIYVEQQMLYTSVMKPSPKHS